MSIGNKYGKKNILRISRYTIKENKINLKHNIDKLFKKTGYVKPKKNRSTSKYQGKSNNIDNLKKKH